MTQMSTSNETGEVLSYTNILVKLISRETYSVKTSSISLLVDM